MTTEDRITKLETIIETQLTRIVDSVESIYPLKLEAEEMKAFRREFDNKVRTIVAERLNTIQFEADVKDTINSEVIAIFNKPEIRNDFERKVQAIIHNEFKSKHFEDKVKDKLNTEMKSILLNMYIKLTAIVGTLATSLTYFILEKM